MYALRNILKINDQHVMFALLQPLVVRSFSQRVYLYFLPSKLHRHCLFFSQFFNAWSPTEVHRLVASVPAATPLEPNQQSHSIYSSVHRL